MSDVYLLPILLGLGFLAGAASWLMRASGRVALGLSLLQPVGVGMSMAFC